MEVMQFAEADTQTAHTWVFDLIVTPVDNAASQTFAQENQITQNVQVPLKCKSCQSRLVALILGCEACQTVVHVSCKEDHTSDSPPSWDCNFCAEEASSPTKDQESSNSQLVEGFSPDRSDTLAESITGVESAPKSSFAEELTVFNPKRKGRPPKSRVGRSSTSGISEGSSERNISDVSSVYHTSNEDADNRGSGDLQHPNTGDRLKGDSPTNPIEIGGSVARHTNGVLAESDHSRANSGRDRKRGRQRSGRGGPRSSILRSEKESEQNHEKNTDPELLVDDAYNGSGSFVEGDSANATESPANKDVFEPPANSAAEEIGVNDADSNANHSDQVVKNGGTFKSISATPSEPTITADRESAAAIDRGQDSGQGDAGRAQLPEDKESGRRLNASEGETGANAGNEPESSARPTGVKTGNKRKGRKSKGKAPAKNANMENDENESSSFISSSGNSSRSDDQLKTDDRLGDPANIDPSDDSPVFATSKSSLSAMSHTNDFTSSDTASAIPYPELSASQVLARRPQVDIERMVLTEDQLTHARQLHEEFMEVIELSDEDDIREDNPLEGPSTFDWDIFKPKKKLERSNKASEEDNFFQSTPKGKRKKGKRQCGSKKRKRERSQQDAIGSNANPKQSIPINISSDGEDLVCPSNSKRKRAHRSSSSHSAKRVRRSIQLDEEPDKPDKGPHELSPKPSSANEKESKRLKRSKKKDKMAHIDSEDDVIKDCGLDIDSSDSEAALEPLISEVEMGRIFDSLFESTPGKSKPTIFGGDSDKGEEGNSTSSSEFALYSPVPVDPDPNVMADDKSAEPESSRASSDIVELLRDSSPMRPRADQVNKDEESTPSKSVEEWRAEHPNYFSGFEVKLERRVLATLSCYIGEVETKSNRIFC